MTRELRSKKRHRSVSSSKSSTKSSMKNEDLNKKSKSSPSLDKLLNEADNEAATQKVVAATSEEKQDISKFCSLKLKAQKIIAKTRELVKPLKPEIKQSRAELLEFMKKNELEIAKVPEDARKDGGAKGEAVPKYLRLVKNSKDVTITPEVVKEALDLLTDEDIESSEQSAGHDAFIECFINCTRRLIRSFNEQVKLTNTLPRGQSQENMPLLKGPIKSSAIQLHEKSSIVGKTEKKKREDIKQLNEDIETQTGKVKEYFERCGLNKQRIHVENATYNLCKKENAKRPKITLAILENILQDSLKVVYLENRADDDNEDAAPPSKEEMIEFLNDPENKDSLYQDLVKRITEFIETGKEESKKTSLVLKKTQTN